MSDRIEPIPAWTVKDWMVATGRCRSTVMKMIKNGEIPARQSKEDGKWYTPALEALAWMRGEWTPRSKPVALTPENLRKQREPKQPKVA